MKIADKIKEAKHILTMIEAGDINHDEINARVSCVVFGYKFEKLTEYGTIISDNPKEMMNLKKFTQSLDACQSLMLEGWILSKTYTHPDSLHKDKGHTLAVTKFTDDDCIDFVQFSSKIEVMPEAWLWAILESYIYEWSNEDD